MGDGLNIQQGGHAVATDELLTAVEGFRLGAENLRNAQHILSSAHRMGIDGFCETGAFPALSDALRTMLQAMFQLERITKDAEEIGTDLLAASDAYAWCEVAVERTLHFVVGNAMGSLGFVVGRLLPWWFWLLPISEADDGPTESKRLDGTDDPDWLTGLFRSWLAADGTVTLMGEVVDGSDNFVLGLAGIPWLAPLIDEDGLGLVSSASLGALGLLAIGNRLGILVDGPVETKPIETKASADISMTTEDYLEDLPQDTVGESVNVVVSVIHFDDGPDKYEVAISGTKSFDAVSRGEAADMTSNFWSIAGQQSAAYTAVLQAMEEAGVKPGSEISLVGHSQGALIAAQIAASETYEVKNLVTAGGPLGEIAIPESVNSILISHDEDLVTQLGGTASNTAALKVSRNLYDMPWDAPINQQVPAHHIEPYVETARLLDAGTSPQVRTALAELADFTTGATSITTTSYRATRTDAG